MKFITNPHNRGEKEVSVLVVRKMEDDSRWRWRLLSSSSRSCLSRFSRGRSDRGSSTFLKPQLSGRASLPLLSPHHWNLDGQRCSCTREPELSPGTALIRIMMILLRIVLPLLFPSDSVSPRCNASVHENSKNK